MPEYRLVLTLRCQSRVRDMHTLEQSILQASEYARLLNLSSIVLVVFLTGVEEDEVMQLKAKRNIGDIMVYVEPVVI